MRYKGDPIRCGAPHPLTPHLVCACTVAAGPISAGGAGGLRFVSLHIDALAIPADQRPDGQVLHDGRPPAAPGPRRP